jgi:hypothetical protein
MLILPTRCWYKLKNAYDQLVYPNPDSGILTVTAEKNTLQRSNRLNRVAWPSARSGIYSKFRSVTLSSFGYAAPYLSLNRDSRLRRKENRAEFFRKFTGFTLTSRVRHTTRVLASVSQDQWYICPKTCRWMPHRRLASKGVYDENRHGEEPCTSRFVARRMLLCASDTLHLPRVGMTDVMAEVHGDGRADSHLRIVRAQH